MEENTVLRNQLGQREKQLAELRTLVHEFLMKPIKDTSSV